MKVTMYSNFLNHHQLPFCQAMVSLLGEDFTFAACEPVPQERERLGYADMNSAHGFVIRTYEDPASMAAARRLALESEIVILGHAPEGVLESRMAQNKFTFRYAERLFKNGQYRRFIPTTWRKVARGYTQYREGPFHVLCASAFTASDLSLCGFPSDKCLRWGYFPEVSASSGRRRGARSGDGVVRLIWVGRLLDWKHPTDAVELARRLRANDVDFALDIIGTGPQERRVAGMVRSLGLGDRVNLLGSMTPEEVRQRMDSADVFLLSSDRAEGWGAVLNEAMATECAVVASHEAGSVPYLLQHEASGLIYRSGDLDDLYVQVRRLVDDPALCRQLASEARATMTSTWNASVAADRLLRTAEALREGGASPYRDGPCSPAPVLSDDWFLGEK